MTVRMLVIREQNFMVQTSVQSEDQISVRIDATDGTKANAVLLKINDQWCFALGECPGYWDRGSNIGTGNGETYEAAIADMFGHIRACNYGR